MEIFALVLQLHLPLVFNRSDSSAVQSSSRWVEVLQAASGLHQDLASFLEQLRQTKSNVPAHERGVHQMVMYEKNANMCGHLEAHSITFP